METIALVLGIMSVSILGAVIGWATVKVGFWFLKRNYKRNQEAEYRQVMERAAEAIGLAEQYQKSVEK